MIIDLFHTRVDDLSLAQRRECFYRRMLAVRLCEERLLDLFTQGLVRGTVHTCLGQEACAIGVTSALDLARDIVCSNHRGHGHYLGYSGDFTGLIAEILGLSQGVCHGVGGSQHLHLRNLYTNGILGGMPPIAVGMALAEKRLNTGAVACIFLGDGAMAEGSCYEALNLAALWHAPVLFAVEQNQYAQTTHWSSQHAGSLQDRAPAFGVPTTVIDGNDVEAVYQTAGRLLAQMRTEGGPQMLFMNTYRLGPHSKGDDLRPPEEIAANRAVEPLKRLEDILGRDWCAEQHRQIATALDKTVNMLASEIK